MCSRIHGKLERYCSNVICGAPTTVKVKGLRSDDRCLYLLHNAFAYRGSISQTAKIASAILESITLQFSASLFFNSRNHHKSAIQTSSDHKFRFQK